MFKDEKGQLQSVLKWKNEHVAISSVQPIVEIHYIILQIKALTENGLSLKISALNGIISDLDTWILIIGRSVYYITHMSQIFNKMC